MNDIAAAEALKAQADFYRVKEPLVPVQTDYSISPVEYYRQFDINDIRADLEGTGVQAPNDTSEFQRWAERQNRQSNVKFKTEEEIAAENTPVAVEETEEAEKAPRKKASGFLTVFIGWTLLVASVGFLVATPLLGLFILVGASFFTARVFYAKHLGNVFTYILGVMNVFSIATLATGGIMMLTLT